jgi:hypothetical protein
MIFYQIVSSALSFFFKYILVNKKRKGVQLKYIGSILEQPQLEEGEEKKNRKVGTIESSY